MWYPATITTPAAAEPVTLDEAKAQCRVDFDSDDALIGRLISAARNYLEKRCAARFASQTVAVKCDEFADMACLSEAPVTSVTSIEYIDTAGAAQTLAPAVYELRDDGLDASVALKYGQRWPSIQPRSRITLTATVGYDAAPEAIRHAMLFLVDDFYRSTGGGLRLNRDSVDGVGEQQFFRPEAVAEATDRVVEVLTAPYTRRLIP